MGFTRRISFFVSFCLKEVFIPREKESFFTRVSLKIMADVISTKNSHSFNRQDSNTSIKSAISDLIYSIEKLPKQLSRQVSLKDKDKKFLPSFLQDEEQEENAISCIRARVIKEINEIPKEIHPKDVQSINESDEMIARYLYDYVVANLKKSLEETCEEVAKNIMETLKWNNSFGVYDLKTTDFPAELSELKVISFYVGHDDRLYICLRGNRTVRTGHEWSPLMIKFLVFEMARAIEHFSKVKKRGILDMKPVLISDCTGVGLNQVDMEFSFSIYSIILKHFPSLYHEIWAFGLPWYCKSLYWVCLKFLPLYLRQRVKLMDFNSAVAEVGVDNLPKYMGGTQEDNFFECETSITLEEAGRLNGVSDKEIARWKKHMEKIKTQK